MNIRSAAVILAAGSGTRVGAETNKVLLPLEGMPILAWSVRTVLEVQSVHRIVLVVRPQDRDAVAEAVTPHLGAHDLWVVDGGAMRHDSEWRALQTLERDIERGELDVVAIHDAARPLAPAVLWDKVIEAAAKHGGAVPVVPTPQLSHRNGRRAAPGLVAVQTPQAFAAGPLLAAYHQAEEEGYVGTDTASCLERYADVRIHKVRAPVGNLKVTFPEDLRLAEALLGHGQDRTPLATDG